MHRALLVAIGVALTGSGVASAGSFSCIPSTPSEQFARADIVFRGIALDGPTATGVQRFRVTRYLKSAGPRIVRVQTGTKVYPGGGGSTTSVSIRPAAGETWRIYANGSPRRVLRTSECSGSIRLRKSTKGG